MEEDEAGHGCEAGPPVRLGGAVFAGERETVDVPGVELFDEGCLLVEDICAVELEFQDLLTFAD